MRNSYSNNDDYSDYELFVGNTVNFFNRVSIPEYLMKQAFGNNKPLKLSIFVSKYGPVTIELHKPRTSVHIYEGGDFTFKNPWKQPVPYSVDVTKGRITVCPDMDIDEDY